MVRAAHLIYTGGKDATRCMGQVKRRRAISQTRHNQERCLLSEENSAPTTTETPWQYVRSSDFAAPSGTVQQTVRTGLTGFWESLRRRDGDDESVFEPIDNLHALPELLLRRTVPLLDDTAAGNALRACLQPWLDRDNDEQPAVVVLGPPHTGGQEALRAWQAERGWRLIEPPTPEQILAQDLDWLDALADSDGRPWVLPALDKLYLRHTSGLALVRTLFDRLWRHEYPHGVIGCDSWAWSYLRYVWQGRMPQTYALQAFDRERLAMWIAGSVQGGGRKRFVFRQADDGAYVLPPDLEPDAGKTHKSSRFLEELAVYSHGNPGVSATIWRQSLQAEADIQVEPPDEESTAQVTIWVTPWERVKHPMLPSTLPRREMTMVLHTLLLHGGLSTEILPQLLPLSTNEIMQTMVTLQSAGLVDAGDDCWRVSALGYPVVRQVLKEDGYLIDSF